MTEARTTQAGVYVEAGSSAAVVTQAGVYVEAGSNAAVVTQAGVYVEIEAFEPKVTQAGVYVEIVLPPPTVGPGVWVIYDGIDITEHIHSVRLEASINQWNANNFGSSGSEYGSGLAKWRLPLTGHWQPDWDATLMPDAVTPPITPKDVTVYIWDRPTGTRVEYFWDDGGTIKQVGVGGDVASAIGWDMELILAGAPHRTVD